MLTGGAAEVAVYEFQSRRLRAQPPRYPNCNAAIVLNPANAVSRSEKPSAIPIAVMPAATATSVGTRIKTLKCNPRIVPMIIPTMKSINMISPLLNGAIPVPCHPLSRKNRRQYCSKNDYQCAPRIPALILDGPWDVATARRIDVENRNSMG
jgi:hypothetical protein